MEMHEKYEYGKVKFAGERKGACPCGEIITIPILRPEIKPPKITCKNCLRVLDFGDPLTDV